MSDQAVNSNIVGLAVSTNALSVVRHSRRVDSVRARYIPRPKFVAGATSKPCKNCGIIKPLTAYSLLHSGALGRQARCKPCVNARGVEYTKRTRELRADRPRPERCEICKSKPGKRALHWDHDHLTGKFRGWLCSHCNAALGHVMDSPKRLRQLIRYLGVNRPDFTIARR